MTLWLLDRFDDIDPRVRRLWAARLLIAATASMVVNEAAWLVGSISHEFMDNITNVLSWLALIWTGADVLMTSDVRTKEDEG